MDHRWMCKDKQGIRNGCVNFERASTTEDPYGRDTTVDSLHIPYDPNAHYANRKYTEHFLLQLEGRNDSDPEVIKTLLDDKTRPKRDVIGACFDDEFQWVEDFDPQNPLEATGGRTVGMFVDHRFTPSEELYRRELQEVLPSLYNTICTLRDQGIRSIDTKTFESRHGWIHRSRPIHRYLRHLPNLIDVSSLMGKHSRVVVKTNYDSGEINFSHSGTMSDLTPTELRM